MIVFQNNKRIFLVLFTVFSLVGIFFYSDYPSKIRIKFFPSKITSFMNANLGDSKQEIIYKFGNPTLEIPKTIDSPEGFFYSFRASSSGLFEGSDGLMIFFNENKVGAVTCGSKCDPIFGLSLGDSELNIIELLGNNFEQSFIGNRKWIYYRDLNVRFTLEKEKIVGIMIQPYS